MGLRASLRVRPGISTTVGCSIAACEKKDHGIRQTINTETETTRMITPCSTQFVTPDPLVMLWTANGPMPPKDSHSNLQASPLEGRENTCRKQRPGPPGHGPRSHSLMRPRGGRLTPVQVKCMHRISPWPLQPNPLQNPSQWGFVQSSHEGVDAAVGRVRRRCQG